MGFNRPVGLVLSGGGMRGIAHVGVIKALQDFDIEPNLISGSSMGAIIGALYANEISPEEMLDYFKQVTLFSLRNYAFWRPGILEPRRFKEDFDRFFHEDSFSSLSKQLYVSVTNLTTGKNQIIERGSLFYALMSSAAFPGIFTPVRVGNSLYADGGITNNFPIEPLQSRCELLIGSYVNPLKNMEAKDFKNSFSVMERAFHISMYEMEVSSFHIADVFIMPEALKEIPTFSLKYIDYAYQAGYEVAAEQITNYLMNMNN